MAIKLRLSLIFPLLFLSLTLPSSAQSWDATSAELSDDTQEAIDERAERADYAGFASTAMLVLKVYPPFLSGEAQTDAGLSMATNVYIIRDMLAYNSAVLQHQLASGSSDDLELGAKLFESLSARLRRREMESVWKDPRTAGPLGLSAALLQDAERLTEVQRKRLRDLAILQQSYLDDAPDDGPVPDNHLDALRRFEGMAWLAKVFPSDPGLTRLREASDTHFAALLQLGDVVGDSEEQAEALARAVSIAKARGSMDELAALKPAFVRLMACLDPAGYSTRYAGGDWGPAMDTVVALEAAARIFKDGSYLEAAHRAFLASVAHNAAHHRKKTGLTAAEAHRAMALLNLPELPEDLSPSLAKTRSMLLEGDKLVLRPRSAPDAPHLLMDLSPRGHLDQRPAIASFSTGGVPHFRGPDDKLWRAQCAALLMVQALDLPFPFSAVRMEKIRINKKEEDTDYAYWDEGTGPFIEHYGLKNIAVKDLEHHSEATMEFAPYGAPGNRLTRHILLTTEGVLLIHDVFASETFSGYVGPLWPLENDGAEDDNVFIQPQLMAYPGCHPTAPENKLVVAFAGDKNTFFDSTGTGSFDSWAVRKAARGSKAKGRTAYAKREVSPGDTVSFLTVALAVPSDMDDEEAVKAVRLESVANGGIDATIRRGKEKLFFAFAPEKAVKMIRRN